MAQIYSGYAVPCDISWTGGGVSASSMSLTTSTKQSVYSGGSSYKISWKCRHYTYQLQYRVRRRLSPAFASSQGKPSDSEVWEEWGSWQGHDLSDVKSDTEKLSWGDLSVTAAAFHFPYDFTQYDKVEYQVRVRAFDEATFQCSEWGYGDLSIVYEPIATVLSAIPQANGDVLLTVGSNWPRGGNRFSLTDLRRDDPMAKPVDGSVRLSNLKPTFTATVPASMIGDAKKAYATMRFYTSDGNLGNGFDEQEFTVGANTPPSSIAKPTVRIEDVDTSTLLYVISEGGDYTSVFASAIYEDALGNKVVQALPTYSGGFVWGAYVDAAPYDVPVTYRVSYANADGWDTVDVVHTTPSNGRCTWSDEETAVSITLDIEASSSYTSNVEIVETTRGTSVARLGNGGSRSLSVSGKIIASETWKADLEKLRQPKKWHFRKPGGERYDVVIMSVSEADVSGKYVEVSISMQEVE